MWNHNTDWSENFSDDLWPVYRRFAIPTIPTFSNLEMPLPQYWELDLTHLGQRDDDRFSDDSVRSPFVRKVYAILSCQMLITTGFLALFLYLPLFSDWAKEPNNYTIPVLAVSTSMCMLAMAFKDSVRRRSKFPGNFMFLITFTIVESLLLGVLTAIYDTKAMFMGMGLVAAVCVTLTFFACEECCGMLSCVTIVPSMSYGIYWILVLHKDREQISSLVWAAVVAFIISCFFIFDMSQMMYNRKHSVSPNEYTFAVLNILWDTLTLFIVIPAYIVAIIVMSIIRLVMLCKLKKADSENQNNQNREQRQSSSSESISEQNRVRPNPYLNRIHI